LIFTHRPKRKAALPVPVKVRGEQPFRKVPRGTIRARSVYRSSQYVAIIEKIEKNAV
jgi:hypothetical protein